MTSSQGDPYIESLLQTINRLNSLVEAAEELATAAAIAPPFLDLNPETTGLAASIRDRLVAYERARNDEG